MAVREKLRMMRRRPAAVRAAKMLGVPCRWVGETEDGAPILEAGPWRLVWRDRDGGYWRPRLSCAGCGREWTSQAAKVTGSADLGRLVELHGRRCHPCRRATA